VIVIDLPQILNSDRRAGGCHSDNNARI
jgi:hypothetical protein